ncbi:uncharacterized protein LOC141850043 [Brevipalpus obovatus]|uniref:uncharacterized protein LOC141850043 n=1 Tax=Brevipalpus obovatus TaxID=246614 RepID=UPI003D9E49C0
MILFSLSTLFLCISEVLASDECLADKTYRIDQQIRDIVHPKIDHDFSRLVWESILNADTVDRKISSKCSIDVRSIFHGNPSNLLTKLSGHFPANFNLQTYADFGDYDRCLSANLYQQYDRNSSVTPHYCLISMEPDFQEFKSHGISQDTVEKLIPFDFDSEYGQSLKIGLCVPPSCTSQDIDAALDHALSSRFWLRNEATHCESRKKLLQKYQHSTNEQKLSMLILGSLVISILWTGYLDWKNFQGKIDKKISSGTIHELISPRKTLQDFFSPIGGKRWIFLDQVRLGKLLNVIVFHSFVWPGFLKWFPTLANERNFQEASTTLWFQPIINTFYFESVIMLGGVSSTFIAWKKISRNVSIKTCLWLIIDRFLRFQGIILALILIKIILPILDQGPVYGYFTQEKSNICAENFLYNVLYLTNWIKPENICLQHMWTFTVEFQLYTAAVLFLYLVRKGLKINNLLSLQVIILLLSYTISVFHYESIIPIMIIHPIKASETYNYFKKFYTITSTHAWSYAGSVLITLLIIRGYDRKFSSEKIRKISKILFMITFCALFNSYLFTFIRPTPLISATYIGLHYALFASMVVFILFSRADDCRACLDKEDNLSHQDLKLNRVVEKSDALNSSQRKDVQSEKGGHICWFDIALKMSRNAYYVHDLVIMWTYARISKPLNFFTIDHILTVLTVVALSYVVGFVFQIFVVGPFERLHSRLMRFVSRRILKISPQS